MAARDIDTCFQVLTLKDTIGANFIKIGDVSFPSPIANLIYGHYR